MEAIGVWWLPWSSKPVVREQRTVGSIPIRFRHHYFRNLRTRSSQSLGSSIFFAVGNPR